MSPKARPGWYKSRGFDVDEPKPLPLDGYPPIGNRISEEALLMAHEALGTTETADSVLSGLRQGEPVSKGRTDRQKETK